MVWKVLGILFIVNAAFIGWSLYTAPLMPDDYDLKEEDIWPVDEWSNIEEDEIIDEDHALDMAMNDMVKDFTEDDIKAIIKANENPPKPNSKLTGGVKNFNNANKEN
tara:strand:- start:292 stop:612 length:321 start_codon:yes stop_codon:yes gene_type:complete